MGYNYYYRVEFEILHIFIIIKALQSQNSCNFICSYAVKIKTIDGKGTRRARYDCCKVCMVYFCVLLMNTSIDLVVYELENGEIVLRNHFLNISRITA